MQHSPADVLQPYSLRQRASFWVYQQVASLAQRLLPAKLAKRAQQEPGYAWNVPARMGCYSDHDGLADHNNPSDKDCGTTQPWVWLHAVSLGETRASAPLIEALRQRYPHTRLLLTHGTATGLAAGKALLQPGDLQTWLPWDSERAVHGFLQHFSPSLGLLMETEVWPQLAVSCAVRGVPLFVVNGRLSQQSLRKTMRLKSLSSLAYGVLAGVVAQTQDDARRFAIAGAHVLSVAGNLKFDMLPNSSHVALGGAVKSKRLQGTVGCHQSDSQNPSQSGSQTGSQTGKLPVDSDHSAGIGIPRAAPAHKPVVMLASSREGEEAMWLQALAQLTQPVEPAGQFEQGQLDPAHAAVQWLVVPRHPQRVAQVEQWLLAQGWHVSRRSGWGAQLESMPMNGSTRTVWLGDSMGEMALYYAMSDVALLGGSFAPLGGQNLIEAAACGCVVVAGPHTFNFVQATQQSVEQGACVQVADMLQAVQEAVRLVTQAGCSAELAQRSLAAQAWVASHQGAAARTVAALPDL